MDRQSHQVHSVRVDLPKAFGSVLRESREMAGLTQEKLADLCEYDRTYISLLERGLRQPTLTTIFDFARVLNILPSDILRKVEERFKVAESESDE